MDLAETDENENENERGNENEKGNGRQESYGCGIGRRSCKATLSDLCKSGVVYKIPCANCPASYIGQTGRRLHQRIQEHKRVVRQADFNSSALAEHAWNCEHPVDWSSIEVLANPRDYTSRIVEEAVSIRTTKNTLNRDSGALPTEYDNLF